MASTYIIKHCFIRSFSIGILKEIRSPSEQHLSNVSQNFVKATDLKLITINYYLHNVSNGVMYH